MPFFFYQSMQEKLSVAGFLYALVCRKVIGSRFYVCLSMQKSCQWQVFCIYLWGFLLYIISCIIYKMI